MQRSRGSWLVVAAAVSGCSFEAVDGAEGPAAPEPAVCNATADGAVLCIEFEDPLEDWLASDAVHANHAELVEVTATVLPDTRVAEHQEMSSLTVRETPALDLAAFTIELRVRPNKQVPSKERVGLFETYEQFAMLVDDRQRVRCSLGGSDDDAATATAKLPHEGIYTHVACTYDGSEMRVYLNGAPSGCSALGRAVSTAGTRGSTIGSRRAPGAGATALRDRLVGGIDYARVYGRALTPDELCTSAGQPAGSCAAACPSDTYNDDLR